MQIVMSGDIANGDVFNVYIYIYTYVYVYVYQLCCQQVLLKGSWEKK